MEVEDVFVLGETLRLNDRDLIDRLQIFNLLPRTIQCPSTGCGRVCSLQMRESSLLGHCFWCERCETGHSVLTGSFFETCGASVRDILLLLFFWVCETHVEGSAWSVGCSEAVVLQCFRHFRDICSWQLQHQNDLVLFGKYLHTIQYFASCTLFNFAGGEGHLVQIDELVINRSNAWVLGIYDATVKRGYVVSIPDRSAETLETVISKHVLPGSEICTDCWEGYSALMTLGGVSPYIHKIDPQIGVARNHIARQWLRLKRFLGNLEATDSPFISEYLDQFMWWRVFGPTAKARFRNITTQIAVRFAVN